MSAGPIEDAVLEGLPESVFGQDEWALTITRGLVRRLLVAVETGRSSDFVGAIRLVTHVPSLQHVRLIVNAVCDATTTQAIVAGAPGDKVFQSVAQLRTYANELLDRTPEAVAHPSTPAETIGACDTLLHLVGVSRPELRKHLEAVSALAVRIGSQLDAVEEVRESIRLGALLHDIGHLTTGTNPALAERDPGHATLGDRTLAGIESLRYLAPIVRSHHERYDGSGQPDGLRGAVIPFESRIIAVADAFEHLANRPGRTNPIAAAISELWQDAGSAYDPDVVAAVTRIFNQHWRFRRTASGAP